MRNWVGNDCLEKILHTLHKTGGRKAFLLTPPLSHFTLTLIASEMPFSAFPRPLPSKV